MLLSPPLPTAIHNALLAPHIVLGAAPAEEGPEASAAEDICIAYKILQVRCSCSKLCLCCYYFLASHLC